MKAAHGRFLAVVIAALAAGMPARALAQTGADGSPFTRSIGISHRASIEAFVDPHQNDKASYGFYGVHLKQRLVGTTSGRTEVFATVGSVGSYERLSPWEVAGTNADGTSRFYQVASRTNIEASLQPVFGGGLRSRVTNYLSVRLGLEGLSWSSSSVVGTRLTAGVSIRLGSVSRATR